MCTPKKKGIAVSFKGTHGDSYLLPLKSSEKGGFILFCRVGGVYVTDQVNIDNVGLNIHPQKTRIVRSHRRVIFLGERLPKPFH